MKNELWGLPDDILARLFFRRLWSGYDAGGVNAGRSLRSDLVEPYLALNELPFIDVWNKYGEAEFAEEAKMRPVFFHKPILFGGLENLEVVSSSDISLLCIGALQAWYALHAEETDSEGYIANPWEKKFIDMVCRIMPIPHFPFFKSDKEMKLIAREGNERVRIKNQIDMNHFYDE